VLVTHGRNGRRVSGPMLEFHRRRACRRRQSQAGVSKVVQVEVRATDEGASAARRPGARSP
jgi:hypothetical protein